MGRGGSDTSAAALGAALKADFVEIYTDVEGIMTADPRIVEKANILQQISYAEVCQMAQNGAKVIHPRAVEIAMGSNIPMYVKSTFSDAPRHFDLPANASVRGNGRRKLRLTNPAPAALLISMIWHSSALT